MYKNYLKKHPTCPSCKDLLVKKGYSIADKQLRQLEHKKLLWYLSGGLSVLLRKQEFSWACDNCIESGKAIEADIEKQLYCDNPPHLAYFDQERICDQCGTEFIFSKGEQKHWYETLGFWVQSVPNLCFKCNKERKEARNINTELSNLMQHLDFKNPAELFRISDLYIRMGKPLKAKHYSTLAQKAAKSKEL